MAAWENAPVVEDLNITDKDLDAVRKVESGGRADAVSPKGAIGPYQFMPETAKGMGLTIPQAMDEATARPKAKEMLQQLTNKYGSKEKGLAAYNWGQGNMDRQGYEKAPAETKDYVRKVTAAAGKKAAWESAPVVEDDTQVSPIVQQMNPLSKRGQAVDIAARTLGNTASFADMIIAVPGAVAGVGIDLTKRIIGAARGDDRRTTVQEAAKAGAEFAEPTSHLATDALQKVMRIAGYGKDGQYTQSDVTKVMSMMGDALAKGGEWVEKQTHGLLLKEDVESLANETLTLAGAKGIHAAAKGVVKGMEKTAPDVAKLREDATEGKPLVKPNNLTPNARAKMDIEQTMGIKDPAAREKINKQNKIDALAAFKDDPQYADYLRNYADEEVNQRTVAAQQADVIANAFTKISPEISEVQAKTQVTWNQALPIYKTPGFQRTPEQIIRLRQFQRQGGNVDPKMLAYMAGAGLAVTAGIALDPSHPVEGALLGLAGAAGVKLGGGVLMEAGKRVVAAKTITSLFKPDERLSISDLSDKHEVSINQAARSIWQEQTKIMELSPDPVRRAAITKWMQGDKSVPLTNNEYNAALKAKQFFTDMGTAGVNSGVLHNLLDDYVTNLWDLNGKNKAAGEKIFTNMSPKSRFDIQRKISSLEEGKKMGLVPITEDVATIMGIYGNSLAKTMANKQLIDSLKAAQISGTANTRLMMPLADMPKSYVNGMGIHPQLSGYGVHPDITPSLKFLFFQSSPKGIMAGIQMANTAYKRLAVSFSLFHAKALMDAYIGAGGNPLKLGKMAMGTDKYLEMVKKGGAGDLVDDAYLGGLKFSFDKGSLADEDIRGNFYGGLEKLHQVANEIVPGSGLVIKGIEKVNLASDTFMWNRLHAGMKLNIFAKTMEALQENNAKANAKNPDIPIKSKEQIAKIAASYTNDIFGGLNWRRIAENSKTPWGKDLSMQIMSPEGRKTMQLLMFAPDWTISTTRAALNAFGKGTGIKGIFKPEELTDLHRQYLIRSALYYFTVGDALNYAMSGHHVWDNKDPTMLELGDGRTMQFSKHMMEPVHWITKPVQQAANKMGIMPREIINQVTGKEYISSAGKSPPMDLSVAGRLRHAAKSLAPIAGQGDMGAESRLSGMLGFPIYGKTEEEKAAAKLKRAEDRRKLKSNF